MGSDSKRGIVLFWVGFYFGLGFFGIRVFGYVGYYGVWVFVFRLCRLEMYSDIGGFSFLREGKYIR